MNHFKVALPRYLQVLTSGDVALLAFYLEMWIILNTIQWFNWWVSFAPEFQCCYFCESSCLFYLSFNFDFYVSKIMHL